MKRYIRTASAVKHNSYTTYPDVIEIACEISIDCYKASYSVGDESAIVADSTGKDRVKFQAFVYRVLNAMRNLGYTEIEGYAHNSDYEESNSMYFAYKRDMVIQEKQVRLIVFIRVAEHSYDESADAISRRHNHYVSEYYQYSLSYGDFLHHPIVVEDQTQTEYRKALHELNDAVRGFTTDAIQLVNNKIREDS